MLVLNRRHDLQLCFGADGVAATAAMAKEVKEGVQRSSKQTHVFQTRLVAVIVVKESSM